MSRPIYKVTSKKVTEVLVKELKRKNRYMTKIVRAVKKVMPEVDYVTHYEDRWDGKIVPRALIFKKEFEDSKLDKSKWKKLDRVVYNGKMRQSYWPKVNTKEGKEIASKLREAMPSEKFFQSEEIADLIKYHPKEKTSNITSNSIRVNTLGFGYKKDKDKYTFVFGGYEGYKPPRGVKEMYMSEYEKMFKSK